jgi:hypothetical protein
MIFGTTKHSKFDYNKQVLINNVYFIQINYYI